MAYATINKPTDYFNTILYTGDGSNGRTIDVGFQPDFVWYKERGSTDYHTVFDSIRGATKRLFTNATENEDTNADSLQSFVSNGYTIGTNSGTNGNGDNYVSWNWLGANGTSSNTDGSITSTVSANTTAGFSVVTYTGNGQAASFGHGLTSPKIVLIKDRTDDGNSWYFHTTQIDGSEDYLALEQNTAKSNASSGYSIGASVFNLGGAGGWTNVSSKNYVAYCFKEIKGYSKFNIYTGNGSSSDGPFVYTGFKPAWLMIKKSSGTSNWTMWDTERQSNEINKPLYADLSNAESAQTTVKLDLLSNGFKIRGNGSNINSSGGTYTYMAFAKEPLVGTNNIAATAR